MKRCTKCSILKGFDKFSSNKGTNDGLQSWCGPCVNASSNAAEASKRADRRACFASLVIPKQAECGACKDVKPASQFSSDRGAHNGLQRHCKSCISKYRRNVHHSPAAGSSHTCRTCTEIKAATDFHRNKSRPTGLALDCKACLAARPIVVRQPAQAQTPSLKTCSICLVELPATEFGRNAQTSSGLNCACKVCRRVGYHTKKCRVNHVIADRKFCKKCEKSRPSWMYDAKPEAKDGLTTYCKDCRRTVCKTCRYVIVSSKGLECHTCRTGSSSHLGKQRKLQAELEVMLTEIGVDAYIETCDKKVLGGCSSKRPDIMVQCRHWCVIIECDEQEHSMGSSNYLTKCEFSRMFQVAADCSLTTGCAFLRINPDSYMLGDMEMNPDQATRTTIIKQSLANLLTVPPQGASAEVVYLFYSNLPAWRIDIGRLFMCMLEGSRCMSEEEVCSRIDRRKEVEQAKVLRQLWCNARV